MTRTYRFKESLVEGLIRSRPNRFIMQVELEGKMLRCHCPCTGRIGTLRFEDIPCLMSKASGEGRKTPYTVEAISLDPPENRNKSWVGINQVDANRYVEFYLREEALDGMVSNGRNLRREVPLGRSRMDFLVDDRTYVEVKTLLLDLPCEGHPKCTGPPKSLTDFQRLIDHFKELSKALGSGRRAILLLCYLYPAKPFEVPEPDRKTIRIQRAARAAFKAGVEHWQIDLKVDRKGVALLDYFTLDLF